MDNCQVLFVESEDNLFTKNKNHVSGETQAKEMQNSVSQRELQLVYLSQDTASSKAENDILMVEDRQMQSLSPRKMYHQSIPKCNSAATTQRALLLSQSRMNEVSSSYCGLNKRSIAKRISILSSRRENMPKSGSKISSGLQISRSSKRYSQMTEGYSSLAPTAVFALRSSNRGDGLAIHSKQTEDKPQLEEGRSQKFENSEGESIQLPLPELVDVRSELGIGQDVKQRPLKSIGCLGFKRERELSLAQNHGDTDEAAKFKSELVEDRRPKKARASPIMNF